MVAYSFKKQFIEPIQQRIKRQTIRGPRRRHAHPGEPIQIYFGMRTKHCCKIIDDPICKSVDWIRIEVHEPPNGIEIFMGGPDPDKMYQLDDHDARFLAVQDGFAEIGEMWLFWLNNHGPGAFEGVIIKWRDK